MSGYFVFEQNGVAFDTRDYDITVVPADIDSAPARSYTAYPRGGGNGDILVNTGRFDNVPRSYYILIDHDFVSTYEALCDALLPFSCYGKLMDSWTTDEFFDAYLDGDLKPILTRNEGMGKVLVTFSRKPQRWLNSGLNPISIPEYTSSNPVTITNPTSFISSPIIEFVCSTMVDQHRVTTICAVNGNAQVLISPNMNNLSSIMTAGNTYTYDCSTGELIEDSTGADLSYLLYGNTYKTKPVSVPKLLPNIANIVNSNEGHKCTIIPRWYTV